MSPKRRSLADRIEAPPPVPPMPPRQSGQQSPEVQSPVQQTTEVQTTEVGSSGVRQFSPRRASTAARPPAPASSPEALPKYLQLERKELLIWPDQITELSILARSLNRNRGRAGERITQNTLIRVAVALLLSRAAELSGTTEEELRESLGVAR
jgi:hypothetical protein